MEQKEQIDKMSLIIIFWVYFSHGLCLYLRPDHITQASD
jgi:hypothetical protein